MNLAQAQSSALKFVTNAPNGVLVVTGPTASGKTGFSVELAQLVQAELGRTVEIISVDSRQIYRECDISSAKITPEEMQGVVHHGIDLVNLDEVYDVVKFQRYGFETIKAIQARGNIPMLCGGTMLWLDAITENFEFDAVKGIKSDRKSEPLWPVLKLGLQWPREVLYDRINQRAAQQFESGLIEETKTVMAKYGAPTAELIHGEEGRVTKSAFTSFGYQEIQAYLQDELTYDDALALNQQRNRNYAKRQLTWWRGREDVQWIEMS